MLSDAKNNDDENSFFRPHSVSSEHTHFHAQSFMHLTVWAYIAIAVIVVITSCVLCYAIYSCYQPLRDGSAIVIGETGFNYPCNDPRKKAAKDDASSMQTRTLLGRLFRRSCKPQDDPLSKQETAQIDPSSRVTPSRPEPAHIRDVPHIRVHSARPTSSKPPQRAPTLPPVTTRDSKASFATVISSAAPSHLSSASTGSTAAASDIWNNPKLSPVTGPVLPMTRAPHP